MYVPEHTVTHTSPLHTHCLFQPSISLSFVSLSPSSLSSGRSCAEGRDVWDSLSVDLLKSVNQLLWNPSYERGRGIKKKKKLGKKKHVTLITSRGAGSDNLLCSRHHRHSSACRGRSRRPATAAGAQTSGGCWDEQIAKACFVSHYCGRGRGYGLGHCHRWATSGWYPKKYTPHTNYAYCWRTINWIWNLIIWNSRFRLKKKKKGRKKKSREFDSNWSFFVFLVFIEIPQRLYKQEVAPYSLLPSPLALLQNQKATGLVIWETVCLTSSGRRLLLTAEGPRMRK